MIKKKIKQIDIAVSEARQFIDKALAWKNRLNEYSLSGSKEGGAAKRASMDLTRALVNVRKPLE
jgi:hypothetical protein